MHTLMMTYSKDMAIVARYLQTIIERLNSQYCPNVAGGLLPCKNHLDNRFSKSFMIEVRFNWC